MLERLDPMRMMIPVLIIAAALVACDNKSAEQPRNDSVTANAPKADASKGGAAIDSVRGERAPRNALDSTMLAPPPPLPAAPASLAADTIPLSAPNGAPARYGLKSGLIVHRFTGNIRGERRTLFDEYGMKERREENSVPYPEGTRGRISNVIVITTDKEQAYVDVRTKHGYRTPNEGLKRYLAMGASKKMSLGEMVISESGAERLPDTTIAGYRCRVLRKNVDGMTITNWIWRGIVLREHLASPQDKVEYTMEPVEIKADVEVPAGSFTFPADSKIDPYTPPAPK
jgi:hypothetical protein